MSYSVEQFCYLFLIELSTGESLHFTSSYCPVVRDVFTEKPSLFVQYSNLSLSQAFADISGNVKITIEGFCEEGGITDPDLLLNSSVRVAIFTQGRAFKMGLYKCLEVECCRQVFKMHLRSNYHLTDRDFTGRYSKTCRAEFGDNQCKFDLASVMLEFEVVDLRSNKLTLKIPSNLKPGCHPSKIGYYDNGTVKIGKVSLQVARHSVRENFAELFLFRPLSESLKEIIKAAGKVVVIPSCDKTLTQCHEAYKNTVNFRGEPFST